MQTFLVVKACAILLLNLLQLLAFYPNSGALKLNNKYEKVISETNIEKAERKTLISYLMKLCLQNSKKLVNSNGFISIITIIYEAAVDLQASLI